MAARPEDETGAQVTAAYPARLLVDFLGTFVRGHEGWAPVSAIVALMVEVGLDGPSVRAHISRLKSRGWLLPDKRGTVRGYRLSASASAELAEGDDLIWGPRAEASRTAGWALVTFSVPESAREKRHLLRSRLAALGFGAIGPGTLIAPARMLGAARSVVDSLGLASHADLFVARIAYAEDVHDIIERGWNLADLNAGYARFLREYAPVERRWAQRGTRRSAELDAEAFRDFLFALNHWRVLPAKDPGLPLDTLGPGWHGREAGELFVRLVKLLETRARRHAATYWPP
ncbi:PaaX family transcriptional regulator C-terminal domain-containing protein [Amycolatopsis endophytica]|uniref:Phenylacetic acid degradation operon negative regulatory protein n=1 Tax=Amycolatopsis endophytica TaxID=860233 RepID=A0A853BD88_9PSEU|nr:PaaX family transcriptional regulator C-terminal domain-containing protein [Amycolatopsis endophytica]NYI92396.1 phenylacetic acid degradation operon negative regulatory protein [Amycolatopsis endophytica]